MIARVHVGLDGSAVAEQALAHAAAVARAFDAEIVLVRVLEVPGHAPAAAVDSADWRLARAEAAAYLQELAQRLGREGLAVHGEICEGRAAEQLVDFARTHAVDLIVLGSHGIGGVTRFQLSGTAQKVIADARLSVLLVRSRADRPPAPGAPLYERLMIPLDGSPRAEWALRLGGALARSQRAELLLVSIVPVPESGAQGPRDAETRDLVERLVERQRRAAEAYLEEIHAQLLSPALAVRTIVRASSHVAQTLHEIAEHEGANLVVLSAHGGGSGAAPWAYGAVATHFIVHGSSSLLIFQDQIAEGLPTEAALETRRPTALASR